MPIIWTQNLFPLVLIVIAFLI